MVSQTRIEEAKSLYELYGDQRAAEKMGISMESLYRYLHGRAEQKTMPRVLIYDIETAPALAHTFEVWNVNVMPDNIVFPWFMLGWSSKWLFESAIESDIVTPEEALNRDDKRISLSLWEQINAADIVIGHNIRHFDIKRMNTRFLAHRIPRPLPYRVVDTRDILRKNFAHEHNKLDYVNRVHGLARKLDTGGFMLWADCLKGDKLALAKMQKYNKHDVGCTEELYVLIRGWANSHPNMGLFVEGNGIVCPNCGGEDLGYGGTYSADVNRYRSFRCNTCGAIGRSPKPLAKKETLRSVAR